MVSFGSPTQMTWPSEFSICPCVESVGCGPLLSGPPVGACPLCVCGDAWGYLTNVWSDLWLLFQKHLNIKYSQTTGSALNFGSFAMPRDQRHRAWVFTLNNPRFPEEEPRAWLTDCQYCIWQLERGENGTEHIQGYCIFTNKQSLAAMKRRNGRAHWERRRGNHAEAKAYCSKEESRVRSGEEWGDEPRGQGHRSDLDQVREKISSGVSAKDIADEHFGSWCRYHKAFELYRSLLIPDRDFHTQAIVYWGEPGVGKTRLVGDTVDSSDVYWLAKPNGQRCFWDGYIGQKDVVIDEFFGWLPRDFVCRMLDRRPFRVETKGGSVNFAARRVFITSNSSPNSWWPQVGLGPVRRRLLEPLGVCYKMEEGGVLSEPGAGLEAIPAQNGARVD